MRPGTHKSLGVVWFAISTRSDMAKIGDVYGGNYLKAEDIKGKGDIRVAISEVAYDEYDGKKRAVLHFRGRDKVLPLNVTNANMIAELLESDEMDDWVGQRICLYVTKVDFQGKRVDAIRIKAASEVVPTAAPVSRRPLAASEELSDEDIPF
jgi:hypothetical protein